jgi:ubiquinone/menaquinone biosynthesis C-methylase UbiE
MRPPSTSLFDAYARDYMKELDHPFRRIVDAGGEYFIQAKARIIREFHQQYFNADPSTVIVDIGAGIGLFEKILNPHFDHIIGLDLSLEMLKVAGLMANFDHGRFCQADAIHMPMPADSADIAFTSCVFHHIDPVLYANVVPEFLRITKPGGLVMIFEHNPLNPLTQLVIRTTPLDDDAILLGMRAAIKLLRDAGAEVLHTGFFLYGPKWIDQFLYEKLRFLRRLPFGGQYYIIARKKP